MRPDIPMLDLFDLVDDGDPHFLPPGDGKRPSYRDVLDGTADDDAADPWGDE